MTTYQAIQQAITDAKNLAIEWAQECINNLAIGEKNGCKELQLVVLTNWVDILEGYSCQYFDDDGNAIDPAFECTTQAEILELISKIKALVC